MKGLTQGLSPLPLPYGVPGKNAWPRVSHSPGQDRESGTMSQPSQTSQRGSWTCYVKTESGVKRRDNGRFKTKSGVKRRDNGRSKMRHARLKRRDTGSFRKRLAGLDRTWSIAGRWRHCSTKPEP